MSVLPWDRDEEYSRAMDPDPSSPGEMLHAAIQLESKYVDSLRETITDLVNPLYALCLSRKSAGVVSHRDLSTIFSNIEEIYSLHTSLLLYMKAYVQLCETDEDCKENTLPAFWLAHVRFKSCSS